MKAIVVENCGGPEMLVYRDAEKPSPKAGEALVRLEAVGVNYIDIYHRTGLYPLPRPFIPGSEAAGVVESVGPDVTEVAPLVHTPTLVLHVKQDAVVPFEQGRFLARLIPGARFVPLEGRNHVLLETEPAWPRFLAEVRAFLAEDPMEETRSDDAERPVLQAVAGGRVIA